MFDNFPLQIFRSPTARGRSLILLACIALAPALAAASGFEGTWRSSTVHGNRKPNGNVTTLSFRQFGSHICGEWAEGVGTGKLLGGNITGRARGHQMPASVGEDIYWQRKQVFPHQHSDPALFVLQGRRLIWYVRNKRSQLEKIQTFERVDDSATFVGRSSFTDPQFARLCPAGTDFTSRPANSTL